MARFKVKKIQYLWILHSVCWVIQFYPSFGKCFKRDISYDGNMCSTNLAFEETEVRSLIECAGYCLRLDICLSVFYSATTSQCIGCAPVASTSSNLVPMTESQYYERTSSYIGCYYDTEPRAMPLHHFRSGSMTVEKCLDFCAVHGTLYAGVENANECYCGNSYELYGVTHNCNKACTGNSGQICGGFNAMNVYSSNSYTC